MKKIILLITALLCCALLLASCGEETPCAHNSVNEHGECLNCGDNVGITYTVNIVTPDGTTTQTLRPGELIAMPDTPTVPEGYEFIEWRIGDKNTVNFDRPVEDYARPLSDKNGAVTTVTINAVVEPKTWKITYMGGASGSVHQYKTGETVEITTESTYGDYYEFVGWYFDEELTQPATVISGKMEDITLWPKVYYLPFRTVTESGVNAVALSDLRPTFPTWNENGDNTLVIPETYKGKIISSVSVDSSYLTHLVIESKYCWVTNLPSSLKSIEVSEDHEYYKTVDGSLYSKDGTVLYRLCLPKNALFAEIPEGVTTIGSEAIRSTELKRLTLPSTLTTIEEQLGYTGLLPELYEIYNLSEHITLTVGSSDYDGIARYAYAVHTDINAESIFDEIDGFVFLDIDEVKYLIGYVGTDTVITLPDTFVYDIYEEAFRYSNFTEITVSAGVRKIGNYAFPGSLQKITFEGMGVEFLGQLFWWASSINIKEFHVKSIEQWLSFTFDGVSPFYDNDAGLYIGGTLVTDVVIPDGASIPSYAFSGYQHLNSVTVGAGVTVIPSHAFKGSSVVTVTLSDDVSEIANYAFGNCPNLATVKLPSNITSLNASAFEGCDTLIEITADGAKYIGNWLIGASSDIIGDTLTIREGTVGIAAGAISHSSIKTVTIPESVKYIGSRAITGRNIEVINYSAIDAVTDGEEIFYQAGMNGNGITVYIGANVKSIPANLFGGGLAPSLVYGTYAAKVKNVVFLGNAVKSIGDSAFRGAIYLESITLPNSLESIGNRAFYCCRALTTVNIPKNVKTISVMAFADCFALTSVNYYAKNASIESSSGSALFGGAGSNADTCVLTIGSEVASIPGYIFYSAYFTSVIIEQGAVFTSIGDYAFYNNDRLVSIDLPDSVDTLGEYAFAYCDSITSINGTGLAYVHEKAVYESRNMPDDWGYEVYGNINYYFKTPLHPTSDQITWAAFKPGSVIPDRFFKDYLKLQHVYIPEGCTVGDELFAISSFSNIDKRLTLRVFFEDNDYNGTSAWRRIITHEGTEYKHGMIVSVNGENTSLGTAKYNVPLSKDGFAYVLDTKTTPPVATVLGYFATSESLTIGGQIDGYTVYDIDDYAFYMHDGIGKVVVSAGIGDMAFAASSIKSITLVDVDDIGDGAFMACTSLTEAELGAIEEIGAYAFNGCTALTIVGMSSSTEHNAFIRDYSFAGCTSLTEITLPANIYTIGTGAFSQSGLAKIYSPQVSEWYIIADAASTNPDIISTYTVTTPEALAKALVTTYANYYWANKALMTQ